MTTRPPGGSSRGAARFTEPATRERGGFSAFAAAIALLALVVGVPAVLLALAGPVPLPQTRPDVADLTHTVDSAQVLSVLVIVVWLAWLQFILCVAVEVAAALRGGVLAVHIPFSGPSQRLARLLVASVLLAGTVVGQVSAAQAAVNPALAGAGSDVRTVATAAPFSTSDSSAASAPLGAARAATAHSGDALGAASALGAAGALGAVNGSAHSGADARAGRLSAGHLVAATQSVARPGGAAALGGSQAAAPHGDGVIDKDEQALDGRKVYLVEAPQGRHHDSLWAIAERHLGDGRRYQEIYRLNEGRPQPDGRTLHLARLIQPGWRLVMPEDAVGVTRYVADRRTPRPVDETPPQTAHTPGGSSAGHTTATHAQAATTTHAAVTHAPATHAPATHAPATHAPATHVPAAKPPVQVKPPAAGQPIIPLATPPADLGRPPSHDVATPAMGTPRPVRVVPGHSAEASAPSGQVEASAPSGRVEASAPSGRVEGSATAVPSAQAAAPEHTEASELPSISPLGADLLGAGLLAAALLGTLLVIRRRRGHAAETDPRDADTEVWLRTGADADRGALLDLALRSLSRSCRDVGRQLPQAYGAVVDDDGLDLLLTMSHPSPPPPWIATDEGLRWRVTYADAQRLVADGDSAYPLLASVGRDPQGRDALINLGAAAGPVAVVGSPAMAAAVVRALALGLAGNPWSRGIEVLTCDLPPTLPAIAAGRLVPCAGARDLTDQLEQGSGRMPRTGPIQILTGGPAPGSRPEQVAIYGAPLNAPIAQRLQALVVRRTELAVLVTGELPGAAWRLKVDDAGNLSCDELSLNVTANRLGDGSIERLHAMFISASTIGPRLGGPGVPAERIVDDAGIVETDDVSWAQADVRVAILGEVEVRASGMIEAGRLPLFGEIVAYLALHPSGAHPTVLASAIWPRGVTSDVRDATLAHVRDWLGQDPDGSPRLREGVDGRMRLSPEVPCDWDVLRTLVSRSRQAPDPSRERDLLVRALHLVRGPVAGGITHGTYTWLPRTDLERQAEELIVGAAERLCVLCTDEGDPVAVEQAAAAGLRAVPQAQHLWRHIIRAEHALGGPARLARVTEHLRFALATSGADLEPETQALIEHLSGISASTGSAS